MTDDLISLSVITRSGFFTTLNVACRSSSALEPNSNLYLIGTNIMSSDMARFVESSFK